MGGSQSHNTTSGAPAASSSNNLSSPVSHGGPAQASDPWTLCKDPWGRLFLWNTYTAKWTYDIPANSDYSDRVPIVSNFPHHGVAPNMLLSPRVGARPRHRPKQWDKFLNDSGNEVWIHRVTNERRYKDPSE